MAAARSFSNSASSVATRSVGAASGVCWSGAVSTGEAAVSGSRISLISASSSLPSLTSIGVALIPGLVGIRQQVVEHLRHVANDRDGAAVLHARRRDDAEQAAKLS